MVEEDSDGEDEPQIDIDHPESPISPPANQQVKRSTRVSKPPERLGYYGPGKQAAWSSPVTVTPAAASNTAMLQMFEMQTQMFMEMMHSQHMLLGKSTIQ